MSEQKRPRATKTKSIQRLQTSSAPATNRAYQHAKRMILQDSYKGGDLLSEGEVAQELGMSRTPVREAFLRLEAEGLLRLYPKKGALVVPISAGEVEIVMETRRLIEKFAITKLLDSGVQPEIYGQLMDLVAIQESATVTGDHHKFSEADREYHAKLVESTRNTILIDLYHVLRDRQIRMGFNALIFDTLRTKLILEQHRGIAEAIAQGDRDRALNLMDVHLNGTLHVLRQH